MTVAVNPEIPCPCCRQRVAAPSLEMFVDRYGIPREEIDRALTIPVASASIDHCANKLRRDTRNSWHSLAAKFC